MYSSLLSCLNKRKDHLCNPTGWGWVLRDPVVGCFAPALYQLDKEGCIHLLHMERKTYEKLYWQNTAFWIRREHKLRPVLAQLEDLDIDLIPLKGAALLKTVYKNIGLRLMTDVDVLVRHKDFLQTARVLLDRDFQPKWAYPSGDLFEFVSLPIEYWPGELSFYNGDGLHLDLHQDLITYHWFKVPYPTDMNMVWARTIQAEELTSENHQQLWKIFLSPYDMLAHMCLHLALHGIQMVKNLWDVDLFLRKLPENWDWKMYIMTAEIWGLKSATYHAFSFCQEIFGTPIPDDVISALKPPDFDRWQVRKLITPETLLADKKTFGKRYPTLVKFALFDNTIKKLKTIKNLIIPDPAWLENNSTNHSIFGHWVHIIRVLLRGD